jgi:hypothetical protein
MVLSLTKQQFYERMEKGQEILRIAMKEDANKFTPLKYTVNPVNQELNIDRGITSH